MTASAATDSIAARALRQGRERPTAPAYYVRGDTEWTPTTWAAYAEQIRAAGRALVALGLEKGHTVCILAFNRPEWTITDIGCMAAGGVPAGIYQTCSPPEVRYIVEHTEARIVLVEDLEQWAKVRDEREHLPNLAHVVLMKGVAKPGEDEPGHELLLTWEEFIARADEVEESVLIERLEALAPDDLATLIYTSGTTGPPKGVMLSHGNLTWTADLAGRIVSLSSQDRSLSYLPLSHIAEQMFSIHAPSTYGSSIYFARSIPHVPDDLKEVQPTVVFGVPRIWEKMHAKVSAKLGAATGFKATLAGWAMGIGRRVHDIKNRGEQPGFFLGMQYSLANKLIFSKVRPAMGMGAARVCVSGAAPIAREVLEFFAGLDLVIHEVYGQSEDSGPTSFNLPGRTRFGTVGPPVDGVTVKIAEDGEILVQGPNVFAGYYKDKAATDRTLINGWLHSGDLGRIDEQGFLHITGRKKDIIITAGGKNIAPRNLEDALKNIDVVGEAVVIGDRRKFLSALVTIEPEEAEKWTDPEALRAHIQEGVDALNQNFAKVETIKKFTILPRPFSIEDGELTPTMKIKRAVINDRYSETIDQMYGG